MDDVDLIGKACEVTGLFDGHVAAADDGDRLALKEGRVADRAVADARAGEFGFAGASKLPEAGAGGEDDRLGLDLAAVGDDKLAAVSEIYLLYRAASEFGLEVLRVLAECFAEFGACRVDRSGPVFNFVRDVDLTAGNTLFKDKRVKSGAASVYRRRKTRRAGSDYYKFSLFHD